MVLVVAMMIVPLPTWLLDLLLATNLSISALLLVGALFVRDALSFGAFPTLLLLTTLFRLALNVSSTRLILLQADAGEVIRAFGEAVVRGDYVVGAIVFAVLTVVQLVVVARGAERVAEVGARFTLDAMPGKQLAIDGDLRTGLIDAEGAAERRRELEREGQLYGAMDGAMKFVKGDAIASIVIVVINIVGGLAIGVLSREMAPQDALRVYGLLTIGDGLVTQIPSLLVSTAAGMIVTRVASEDERGTLGRDVITQLFADWRALAVAAGLASVLALAPGLPFVPFALLASVLGTVGFFRWRRRPAEVLRVEDAPTGGPVELRVGSRLAATLTDPSFGMAFRRVARTLHDELGLRVPPIAPVCDEGLNDEDAYRIVIASVSTARGRCPAGRVFAVPTTTSADGAALLQKLDPSVILDAPGGWIVRERAALALDAGCEVTEPSEFLIARLERALRERPEALVGIQETQRALDRLARDAPVLVRTLIPERITLLRLTALLRVLASERVSIRPLREILEALAVDPLPEKDAALVELVRMRLARQITHGLMTDGALAMLGVDPMIEDALRDALGPDGSASPDPELSRDVVEATRRALDERKEPGIVVVTHPDVRRALRQVLATELPDVAVLSYRELDPQAPVRRLGVVAP